MQRFLRSADGARAALEPSLELVGRSYAEWLGEDDSGVPIETAALLRYCLQLASPATRQSRDVVRVAYFPTGGPRNDLMLFALVHLAFSLWIAGYRGPVAWLAFPAELMGPRFIDRLLRPVEAADRVRSASDRLRGAPPFRIALTGSHCDSTPEGVELPERTVLVAPTDCDGFRRVTMVFGADCPGAFRSLSTVDTHCEHGMLAPVVCIPSRAVHEVRIARAPWEMTMRPAAFG